LVELVQECDDPSPNVEQGLTQALVFDHDRIGSLTLDDPFVSQGAKRTS